MSGQKKRKVDSKCRVFHREWTAKYFFTEIRSKGSRNHYSFEGIQHQLSLSLFSTKHANYAINRPTQERTATAQRLAASLEAQQNTELFTGIQISKDQ